ncbi:MAG: PAS domain S-box protein [Brevinema sp.]
MYIRLSMIFQLVFMSFSYFFVVISLWQTMGSYVMLFAIIPIMVNVLIFSHVLLNYLSIMIFTFLALYTIRVPLDYMFYEWAFWGVHGIIVMVAVWCSLVRRFLIPSLPAFQNSWMQKFILKSDHIMVQYDVNTETIVDLNASACRLYGWTKKDLQRHSLMMIHPINFLQSPPYDFMEKMKEGVSWHGFLPIVNKEGNVFEERAVYKPVFDAHKRLTSIEKTVIEVVHQEGVLEHHDLYEYFFSCLDKAAVLIDSSWNIENENELFTQKVRSKAGNIDKILDIFPKEIQHKLVYSIKRAFDGNKSSFFARVDGYGFQMPIQFLFLPYKKQYSDSKKALKVFVILDEVLKNENYELVADNTKESVNLSIFLKSIFAEIRDVYDNEANVRLFSGELPTVNISKDIWSSLFTNILLLAMRHATPDAPVSVVLVCSTSFNIHFFKVKYEGIPYDELSQYFSAPSDSTNTSLEARKIKESLAYLAMEPVVIPRDEHTSILCFNFKEN